MLPAELKCYLINLDRSPERLAEIAPRLAAQDIGFERVPGVDGAKLSEAEFRGQTRGNEYYKPLRRGEVGCYLGHLAAMRRFLQSGARYALILEDDAAFSEGAAAVIGAALKLRGQARDRLLQWDVLKLNYARKRWVELAALDENHRLVEYGPSVPSTTTAAIWTREAAQRWTRDFHGVARPIDCDLQHPWEHGLAIRSVHPPIAWPRRVESTIKPTGPAATRNPWPKLRYELRRLWPKYREFGRNYGWFFILGWLWRKRLVYRPAC